MKKVVILVLALFLTCSCSSDNYDGEVNVLNWTSYIPDSVISDFEKEYNIKVNYGTYSSNEELLAKITSSKEGTYDLIFPSDYMVNLMIKRNILERLDLEKFKNLKNINKDFLNQTYDLENKYSLPFLLATSVIAVDTSSIKEDITKYEDLLNDKYKNNIVLIDDQRIVIGAALQSLGYNMNDTSDVALERAYNFLMSLKENVKAFDSDSPKTFLISDEVDIGLMWNAEAIIAQEENENIKIIYPEDGYALSMDNYAIVKGSKNQDNAYLFIDYLLRDDVCKKIIDEYPYISTNKNVGYLDDKEIKDILRKGSYISNQDVNDPNKDIDIKKLDMLWARIK